MKHDDYDLVVTVRAHSGDGEAHAERVGIEIVHALHNLGVADVTADGTVPGEAVNPGPEGVSRLRALLALARAQPAVLVEVPGDP